MLASWRLMATDDSGQMRERHKVTQQSSQCSIKRLPANRVHSRNMNPTSWQDTELASTRKRHEEHHDLEESYQGGQESATSYVNAGAPPGSVEAAEESHTRSALKGLTWRFVATTTTIVIVWIVTGKPDMAFQIGFFEFFAKIAIYYLHERLWLKIKI
jgi:uncharacterized membrane protein